MEEKRNAVVQEAEWIKQLVEVSWLQFFIVEFFFRMVAKFVRIVTAMKVTYKLALLALLVLVIAGGYRVYNIFFNVILEARDVQDFRVREIQGKYPTQLMLSGLAFNSSMGVRNITTEREGPVLTVLVHLSLIHRANSGNFTYQMTVPDSVNEACFGRSPIAIWKRGPPSPSRARPGSNLGWPWLRLRGRISCSSESRTKPRGTVANFVRALCPPGTVRHPATNNAAKAAGGGAFSPLAVRVAARLPPRVRSRSIPMMLLIAF
jgi:hypothetical protein